MSDKEKSAMKLCKDCRWCVIYALAENAKCTHLETRREPSFVTGEIPASYCENERSSASSKCGRDAKLFEPK